MPVSLQYPHTWEKPWKNLEKTCKNLGKPKNLDKNLRKPKKTLEKPAHILENQKKTNNLGKKKLKKKNTIFLDSLEGGGSQPRLSDYFFCWFFQGCLFLLGFPRFLQVFPMFFWFWSLSTVCTFLYSGRSVSSCVQACRNQSFNHCSYEHTGSEDQDCVFQF